MGFEAPQGLIGQIDETLAITDLSDVTAITGTGTTVVFSAGPTLTGTLTFASATFTGVLLGGNGTSGAPTYSFSSEASGLFLSSANALGISIGGTLRVLVTSGTLRLPMGATSGIFFGDSNDVLLAREAAAVLQMGADVNGAAVAQTFKAHDGITGTDIAGANLTLAGGRGTGAGAVGNLLLATSTLLASGTTAQTLTTRVTITGTTITTTLPIIGPNGTAAAPALAFSDANKGIFGGTNTISITIAGSEFYRFQSTGILFLGNSQTLTLGTDTTLVSAANVLEIKKTTSAQTLRVYGTTTGTKYISIAHDGTDGLIDVAASSGQLTLGGTNATGVRVGGAGLNVGFYGTTPIALQTGVAVTAAGIHAALVALGLITA